MPYDCGSTEPTPRNEGRIPPKNESYLPSFVNNLVSPFMSCWQPPINGCESPRRPNRAPSITVSPQKPKPQPTTNIREAHSNDVLCGRGGSSNRHVGNLNFRSLVAANKDMYVTLTKKQKMTVARKIVDAIHNQGPPGRFLQKDSVTGLWFDIGLPRSLEKTSQALREKTATQQTYDTPVSPGGSSVTAVTTVTEQTFSDPGVQTPILTSKSPPMTPIPVSPPGTASSSPVPTLKVAPNDVPDICIPGHLEAQFRPQRRIEQRPPQPPHRYDYYQPPHPHHPYHHPHGPPQSYLPPYSPLADHHVRDYYNRPPPRYSYPPPMPMDPRNRSRGPHPYPPPTYSSAHHVPPSPSVHHAPPSPDRRDYNYHDHRQQHQQHQKLVSSSKGGGSPARPPTSKSYGTQGRQTTEVSPSRAQAWKKRRTGVTDEMSLTQDMQNQLSLRESKDLASPSSVLQSRSRRGMASTRCSTSLWSRSSNRGDALAGLAALSSAALLKLDEDEGKEVRVEEI